MFEVSEKIRGPCRSQIDIDGYEAVDLTPLLFYLCGSQPMEVNLCLTNFKRPNSREDSSDFHDFRTELIALSGLSFPNFFVFRGANRLKLSSRPYRARPHLKTNSLAVGL